LEDLGRLGEGAGGAVHKVRDTRTGDILARKTIPTRTTPARQVTRELGFLSSSVHENIIKFYGAYMSTSSSEVKVVTEYCEGGSLEAVGKRVKEIGARASEKVIGKLAEGVSAHTHAFIFYFFDLLGFCRSCRDSPIFILITSSIEISSLRMFCLLAQALLSSAILVSLAIWWAQWQRLSLGHSITWQYVGIRALSILIY
jgi:serine/threonine protein kinase